MPAKRPLPCPRHLPPGRDLLYSSGDSDGCSPFPTRRGFSHKQLYFKERRVRAKGNRVPAREGWRRHAEARRGSAEERGPPPGSSGTTGRREEAGQ